MSSIRNTDADAAAACEHCGRTRPVMIVMDQGAGSPWRLCSNCYLDGLRPMNDLSPHDVPAEVQAPQPSSAPAPRKAKKKSA